MLSRRRTMSLSTILVITMVLVTVLPNMVFGFLSTKLIEDSLLTEAERSSVLIAGALSEKMTLSFKGPLKELVEIRDQTLASGNPSKSFAGAVSSQAAAGLFRRIEITDAAGRVAVDWPPSPGRIGTDRGVSQYQAQIVKGYGYFLSSRYVSFENGRPVFDLVLPYGEGLLIGTMEAQLVQDYFAVQRSRQDAVIGILDGNGAWLASTDLNLVGGEATAALASEWAVQPSGSLALADIDGEKYLPYVEKIGNSEWSVIILSSVSSLKAATEYLKMGITFTVMILLIISLGLLVLIGRKVKGQTRQILEFAERISAGRYAFLLPPKMFREMEELLEHFEEMAKKIEKREQEINDKNRNILMMNLQLEERVAERTRQLYTTNMDLEKTLHELRETQNQLIETERMANLGNLVAGVAHEINTPIGVSITSVTFLGGQIQKMKEWFESSQLKRSVMQKYLDTFQESTQIITTNLNNAAELIRSFKQIAVDQSTGENRRINVQEYIEGVVLSLKPELRNHTVDVDVQPPDIEFDCNPGDLSQMLGNLLTNSVKHGFEGVEHGHIGIICRLEDNQLLLKISDDGVGIPEDHLKSIYEPFFTTKRGSGGTGLGLNIVYNIVKQKFEGSITCDSAPGKGTRFTIGLPVLEGASDEKTI